MRKEIMLELNKIKHKIPPQTYSTIIGQMRAGDTFGAKVGIERLKKRIEREEKRQNETENIHG